MTRGHYSGPGSSACAEVFTHPPYVLAGFTMPTFTPTPSNPEAPAGGGPLFTRFGLNRGISVVQRQDGTFYTTRYPSALELDEAKQHWLGGYTYDIDADTAALLTAAGFTVQPDTYRADYESGYN